MNAYLQKVVKHAIVIFLLFFFGSLLAEPLDVVHLNFSHLIHQQDKTTKLHPALIKKLRQFETQSTSQIHLDSKSIKNKSKQLILIDAIAKGYPEILLNDLLALGLQSAAISGRIISGQLPLGAFDKLDSLQSLNEIKPNHIIASQGSVTTQGDQSQKSDLARQNFSVDGSGITVGVISDSYNCLGGASADKQSKDLPENTLSVKDALNCTGKTDEGRALMQIIHDIAPGAHLVFHSGANGFADTANAITKLAFELKVDIIVDDIKFISANFFQEDPISQAVNRVVQTGVVYVTAAGNSGRNSYQSTYNEYINTAFQLNAHDFDPSNGVDIYQRIHVPEGLGFNLLLQWDSPAYSISGEPGSQTDLDIFIFNESHTKILTSSTFGNIGRDPVEFIQFFNPKNSGQNKFDLMITKPYGASPRLLKYIILNSFDGIIQEFKTDSSGLFGHANSKFAITIGAANYLDTPAFGTPIPLLEYFSSAGGTPLRLDSAGNVIGNPSIPEKPDVVAPDDVNTTFFGGIDTDNDGKPNISGTSAAAPHAAGVVALLLESNRELQPTDIKKILHDTAIDILQRNNDVKTDTGSGFDFDSGHGLINSEAAVNLSTNFLATTPEPYIENTDKIIVNNLDQSGGGGIFDSFSMSMILIVILLSHRSINIGIKTQTQPLNLLPAHRDRFRRHRFLATNKGRFGIGQRGALCCELIYRSEDRSQVDKQKQKTHTVRPFGPRPLNPQFDYGA
jgi:subtilisin family serine protease